MLLTSTKNGDKHNVNVALASGANVNVKHGGLYEVSILIIVYVLLIVLVVVSLKPWNLVVSNIYIIYGV